MDWSWEKAVGGGVRGAAGGTAIAPGVGTAVGAVAGFVMGGLEGGVPGLEELGLMSVGEYEQYLKGAEAQARMEGSRRISRALAARGGLTGGALASEVGKMETAFGAQRSSLMGLYQQSMGEISAQLKLMESAEQKEFWGGITRDLFSIAGSYASYNWLMEAAEKGVSAAEKGVEAQKVTPETEWGKGLWGGLTEEMPPETVPLEPPTTNFFPPIEGLSPEVQKAAENYIAQLPHLKQAFIDALPKNIQEREDWVKEYLRARGRK